MIRILHLGDAAARSLRAEAAMPAGVAEAVGKIVADVRARGDAAVRELTERFDHLRLDDLFLDDARWDALAALCPLPVRQALEVAHERVRAFHLPQVPPSYEQKLPDGGILKCLIIPLRRAACYVPGGRGSYPSTVIMTATVARLAGVPEVIVATPRVAPEVAAAARIAGATRILQVGGAHAIAALAIGTGTIPRVDVIVGPGNAYVTEAKRQLSGEVRIDSLAGPTEVVIVADESADPRSAAADLIAQAEHDPLAFSVLVTPSEKLAREVAASLAPTGIAAESLKNHGAIVITRDLDEALAFADELAPEHLELLVDDANDALPKVPRAGAVFVGHHAPVPVGDYLAGPNHTLPTSGTARFASPLSATDFVRRQNVIEYTPEQLKADAKHICNLANAEGLHGHAQAIESRQPAAGSRGPE
ncbi:MAG: histidinol dehydrogenase [Myxococcales bacterium]